MEFTNSPLVEYTKISPFKTLNRNHIINTVTIHCVVGQCTIGALGELFQTNECCSNYGIGYDGRIGMYCEEKDRSWCSSSASNDHRAITIEVASDTKESYAVKPSAYNALIILLADICKRNGIKKLLWQADKTLIGQVDKQNMTVHRLFANKSCPGTYLYDLHPQIAAEVNKQLETDSETEILYQVQVGAFKIKANATAMMDKVTKASFEAYITTAQGQAVNTTKVHIGIGSNVKIKRGAKTYTNTSLACYVYEWVLQVTALTGDRAVVVHDSSVIVAVNINDLMPV